MEIFWLAYPFSVCLRGVFMYDDFISNISYSLIFDFVNFNNSIFSYCASYATYFFMFLGLMIGVKFLKDAFNFCN